MGLNTPWLEADIETLKRMASERHSAGVVTVALGNRYSRSAVLGKAHRMGIKFCSVRIYGNPAAPKMMKKLPSLPVSALPAIGPIGEMPPLDCCQYATGDTNTETYQTCGQPATRNKRGRKTSYCDYHQGVVFVPNMRRKSVDRTAHQNYPSTPAF